MWWMCRMAPSRVSAACRARFSPRLCSGIKEHPEQVVQALSAAAQAQVQPGIASPLIASTTTSGVTPAGSPGPGPGSAAAGALAAGLLAPAAATHPGPGLEPSGQPADLLQRVQAAEGQAQALLLGGACVYE